MPGLFEQFPHTNLHELNLDWIIDLINQFKEELEDSAVLSVNGETGHVTLYESENVILPALPEGVNQWRLVRLMDGQYAGILFYNGNIYFQRGNETMRLLTLEDIPTSAGVVSWNGRTGVVNVTGQDIPVDDTADADSIAQAITTEHTERVNADNALQNSINTTNQAIQNLTNRFTGIRSYTPAITSMSPGFVYEKPAFFYTQCGGLLQISGRFNITNIGSSPDNNSFGIPLPEGYTCHSIVGPCGTIALNKTGVDISNLSIRQGENEFFCQSGAGDIDVLNHIGTGFVLISATIMLA